MQNSILIAWRLTVKPVNSRRKAGTRGRRGARQRKRFRLRVYEHVQIAGFGPLRTQEVALDFATGQWHTAIWRAQRPVLSRSVGLAHSRAQWTHLRHAWRKRHRGSKIRAEYHCYREITSMTRDEVLSFVQEELGPLLSDESLQKRVLHALLQGVPAPLQETFIPFEKEEAKGEPVASP